MISVTRVGGSQVDKTAEFMGLSTDTKPTENIPNGSTFLEMDTGDVYFYNKATELWILPS